jgi:hypothetical protein
MFMRKGFRPSYFAKTLPSHGGKKRGNRRSPRSPHFSDGGGTRRFADPCQDFCCGWDIEERLADMPPLFAAINIHKQSCVQCDVPTVHTGTAMQ